MKKNWFTSWFSNLFGSKPTPSKPNVVVTTPANTQTTVTASVPVVTEPVTGGNQMKKKALLVGINYVGTSNQLNGCINDVLCINQIIRDKYGFGKDDATNVRMLTDESATTANILDRLKWLVEGAKAGDVLLYHFSGHGVQIACPNYVAHEEADGLDECEVPYDFDWRTKVIRDDDFIRIFANVPKGVNLTVISDSCHSGDLLKEIINPLIQPAGSPNKPRTIAIPPDIKNRAYGLDLQPRVRGITNKRNEQVGILISGCKDVQTSADAWIQKTKKYQGALTYYMSEVLAEAQYDITYADLIVKVNKKLADAGYEQEPQLDGEESLKGMKFLQGL